MKTLTQIQQEMVPWIRHNFGERPDWQPVMGAAEEVGELCHAVLKSYQKIRTVQDHDSDAKDACGDTVIYLMDFCNAKGWDLHEIVDATWGRVSQRDWKKNPGDGQ